MIERHANGKNLRTFANRSAAKTLGSQIAWRAGSIGKGEDLYDRSKIYKFKYLFAMPFGDDDIFWLDVAMHKVEFEEILAGFE